MAKEDGLGLLLIGESKKGKGSSSDSDDSRLVAARGLIKALKGEDPERVASAFEEMMACCDDSGYGEESGEKDDSSED